MTETLPDRDSWCHALAAATCSWVDALTTLRLGPPDSALGSEGPERRLEEAADGVRDLLEQGRARDWRAPAEHLAEVFGLSPLDQTLVSVLFATAIDGRIAARCQAWRKSVLKDWLDVDVLVRLVAPDPREWPKVLARLLPGAPLHEAAIVETSPLPGDSMPPPLVARRVALASDLVAFLLGQPAEDAALRQYGRFVRPEERLLDVIASSERKDLALRTFRFCFDLTAHHASPPVLLFCGPEGGGKTVFARAIAGELGVPLLELDGYRLAQAPPGTLDGFLRRTYRTAVLLGAAVLIDPVDPLFEPGEAPTAVHLIAGLERAQAAVLLTCERPEVATALSRVTRLTTYLEPRNASDRIALWEVFLPPDQPLADDVDLPALAERFDFDGRRIGRAVALAREAAATRKAPVAQDDLHKGAWNQLSAADGGRVRRPGNLRLDALVLPEENLTEVGQLVSACRNRSEVLSRWGFSQRLTTGKAVTALFVGEPGTGKTFCGEILAAELGLTLLEVSIPDVLSKWVGETEKRVSDVFREARARQAVLLFDEADSLLASRIKVESSSDRYSNVQVNVLLQEIDRFEGVLVLTTNLERNMDEALRRRILYKITFPFPDASLRAQLWQRIVPPELPLAEPLDYQALGRNFELAGGHIRNAVLRAAFAGMDRDGRVTPADVNAAAMHECGAAGRLVRHEGTGKGVIR